MEKESDKILQVKTPEKATFKFDETHGVSLIFPKLRDLEDVERLIEEEK